MKPFQALDLAADFYHRIEDLKYRGPLQDQMMRAASSVALNLSEGNARHYPKEKRRFFNIAYASLKETTTVLKLARIKDQALDDMADQLGAVIYKLSRSSSSSTRQK